MKDRKDIDNIYKWDIDKMIKNLEEFEKIYNNIVNLTDTIVKMKSTILNNSETLTSYFKTNENLGRQLELIFVYANMLCDTNTLDNESQKLKLKVEKLCDIVNDKLSFVKTELLSKDYSYIISLLNNDYLKQYKLSFERLFRYQAHTLSEKEEAILSKAINVLGTGSDVFYNLNNADIDLGKIRDEDGKLVKLTNSNYIHYVTSSNKDVRKRAFNTLYKFYEKHKNTITSALKSKIKENNFLSKVKNFSSSLEQSLYQDKINISVYKNLINTVHDNLNSMYEYMQIRKDFLNLTTMNMYDIYVDLVKEKQSNISFDEGKKIVIDSLSVLGNDYINDLKKAFEERWIDIYPNIGKKSGAYSWGCYDSYPYLLLNYENDKDSVSTLAHELGHSMHSYYSKKNQIYEYANYPIFLAEIASTVNEILLNEYLYNKAKDNNEKILYLSDFLDKIRTTIYRQTMFAEFELIMHEKDTKNIPLTEKEFSDTYYNLNKLYYGKNVISNKSIRYEWMRIPHFYNSFYVYKYATGLSCAIVIAYEILNGNEQMKNNYLKFLQSGSNGYPTDILKNIGIDIENGQVVEYALGVFSKKLNELKELIRK